jgi:hypothetical protein
VSLSLMFDCDFSNISAHCQCISSFRNVTEMRSDYRIFSCVINSDGQYPYTQYWWSSTVSLSLTEGSIRCTMNVNNGMKIQEIFPSGFPTKIVFSIFYLFHTCYMPHSTWFDYTNSIWWRLQIMEFFIMTSTNPPVISILSQYSS